jgi:hypothetical protein
MAGYVIEAHEAEPVERLSRPSELHATVNDGMRFEEGVLRSAHFPQGLAPPPDPSQVTQSHPRWTAPPSTSPRPSLRRKHLLSCSCDRTSAPTDCFSQKENISSHSPYASMQNSSRLPAAWPTCGAAAYRGVSPGEHYPAAPGLIPHAHRSTEIPF